MINTTTDLATGSVVPFMYLGEEAEDNNGYEVDDTVNIPAGEYEELIDDSMFLGFLRETVGEEVWENAEAAFEEWNMKQEEEGYADMDGGTAV